MSLKTATIASASNHSMLARLAKPLPAKLASIASSPSQVITTTPINSPGRLVVKSISHKTRRQMISLRSAAVTVAFLKAPHSGQNHRSPLNYSYVHEERQRRSRVCLVEFNDVRYVTELWQDILLNLLFVHSTDRSRYADCTGDSIILEDRYCNAV